MAQNSLIQVSTPLAIQGLILEVIRSRFANFDDTFPWKFDASATTDINKSKIDIRLGYNKDDELRNKRPVISVYRGDLQIPKQVINNEMSRNLPTSAVGYGSMAIMQIFVGSISIDLGEAEVLGDVVWAWILANRKIIEEKFGLHEVGNPVLMAPRPFERDKELTEVPVTFNVMVMHRWATQPVAPLIEEIVLKLESRLVSVEMQGNTRHKILIGNRVFQEIAINSLTNE